MGTQGGTQQGMEPLSPSFLLSSQLVLVALQKHSHPRCDHLEALLRMPQVGLALLEQQTPQPRG